MSQRIGYIDAIKQLRLPLIVLITFAHSYSGVRVGYTLWGDGWDTYEVLKIVVSQTLVKVAMPTFFPNSRFFFPDALLPSGWSGGRFLSSEQIAIKHQQAHSVDGLRRFIFRLSGPLCFLLCLYRQRILHYLRNIHVEHVHPLSGLPTPQSRHLGWRLCRIQCICSISL